jgi:hypothetical protein
VKKQTEPAGKTVHPKPSRGETVTLPVLTSDNYHLLRLARQDPRLLTPAHHIQLQRTFGNHALVQLLNKQPAMFAEKANRPAPPIQTKLVVNAVGDKYEQEADAVAKEVVQKLNAPQPDAAAGVPAAPPHAQRQTEEEEPIAQRIQRQAAPEEEEIQLQRQETEDEELQLQRQELEEEEGLGNSSLSEPQPTFGNEGPYDLDLLDGGRLEIDSGLSLAQDIFDRAFNLMDDGTLSLQVQQTISQYLPSEALDEILQQDTLPKFSSDLKEKLRNLANSKGNDRKGIVGYLSSFAQLNAKSLLKLPAIDLLVPIPVPQIGLFHLEVNTQNGNQFIGLHFDVGKLLSGNYPFKESEPKRIGEGLGYSSVQRQETPEEEMMSQRVQRQELEEEPQNMAMAQRQPQDFTHGGPVDSHIEAQINQSRGGGRPLEDSIRQPMEQAFGADFSDVRIHTDTKANNLNEAIQARAFTTDKNIFFKEGEYGLDRTAGQELLAHELTHVVQQTERVRRKEDKRSDQASLKKLNYAYLEDLFQLYAFARSPNQVEANSEFKIPNDGTLFVERLQENYKPNFLASNLDSIERIIDRKLNRCVESNLMQRLYYYRRYILKYFEGYESKNLLLSKVTHSIYSLPKRELKGGADSPENMELSKTGIRKLVEGLEELDREVSSSGWGVGFLDKAGGMGYQMPYCTCLRRYVEAIKEFYYSQDRLSPHWKAPYSILSTKPDFSKVETVKMGMEKAYRVFNYGLTWQERAAIGASIQNIESLTHALLTTRIHLSLGRDIDC